MLLEHSHQNTLTIFNIASRTQNTKKNPTINKKKINQLPYDSVSIMVGIILSEKWTFLHTWVFFQHSV